MRLQKYIALCGVASRRKAEELISDGRVAVNNKLVTELGSKIDPEKDRVQVDGKNIRLEKNKVYILLNKPVGYLSTMSDDRGRKIVTDLIEDVNERVYPVGRLDIDTSGIIILTNDGEIANKIMHPRNEIYKRYMAVVEGVPNKMALEKLRNGIFIEGKKTAKAQVKIAKRYDIDSILDITIHEGRNRQVKKMCEAVNHPVKKLKRVEIGEIKIGGLELGNWRYLNEEELEYLRGL